MGITSENALTVIGKFKQLQRQVWVWHLIQNNITSFNTYVFYLECIPTVIPRSGWWELSHRETGNIEEDGCLPHQVGHLDNLNSRWGDKQWTYLGLVALQMGWVWRNNYFPCQDNGSSISPLLFKNYSWIDVSSKSQNWRWWVQGGAINMSFSEAFRDSQKGETSGQAVSTLSFPTDLETAAAGKALLSPLQEHTSAWVMGALTSGVPVSGAPLLPWDFISCSTWRRWANKLWGPSQGKLKNAQLTWSSHV